MQKFILNTLRHAKLIIFLTLLVTVFMGYKAATKSHMDTDVNLLMPESTERIDEVREIVGVKTEVTNYLILSIEGDDLFNLDVLQTFQDAIDASMELQGFKSVLSPFNFIHFDAEGRRLVPGTMAPGGKAPETEEELAEFKRRVKDQSLSENFVVAKGGTILTSIFTTKEVVNANTTMAAFEEIIKLLENKANVYFTGEVPFQVRTAFHIGKDFSVLLVLALIAMLIIFWLSFRSLRAMILPVSVVMVGAVWTVGFMAIMGYSITVVSVIIPSLILTIGSSYTIHVLSEYYRNTHTEGEDKNEWLAEAVEHVIRTVILAGLTTMICFLSLLVTTLPPLREFGLAIALGIFSCAVLALFFLPAIFSILPPPKKRQGERIHRGVLTKIVRTVGQWSAQHRFTVFGIFVALLVGFISVYPNIKHQSDYFSYFPSSDRIISDSKFINEFSGGNQTFNITLTAPNGEKGYFQDPEVLKKVDAFESAIAEHPSVTGKLSFVGILRAMNAAVEGEEAVPESKGLILLLNRYFRLIPKEKISLNQDGEMITEEADQITIYMNMAEADTYAMLNEDDMRDFLVFVDDLLEIHIGDSMDHYLWGNTVLLLDSSRIIKRDQMISTVISMFLGIIITWFVFKSFALSLFAIIPLLSGIFFYYITLFVLRIPLDMTTILVTNVTVGVGLDDAVHFILQYMHQRKHKKWQEALEASLTITGRAIVLTTVSLVAGLLMLCFASFTPIFYFGILISITLLSTMVGTVVFIPTGIVFLERMKERQAAKRAAKA